MGSEEEDHEDEVPFPSCDVKGTCCQLVTDETNHGHLAEVSHYKYTLFSLSILCSLEEKLILKRQGIINYSLKLFGILYGRFSLFPIYLSFQSFIAISMDSWICI